jgi:trigger factor
MAEEQITSRNIPLPIQREIRQRCGFGCVVCGLPLYEYDHVIDWSKAKTHDPNQITLLCDQHHREKTSGLLPIEEVREANDTPFCHKNGVSKPYDLHYSGTEIEAIIGSNTYKTKCKNGTGVICPIVIDGLPLLAFYIQDNHLLLNLNIFDEFNQLVLQIVNNQLIQSRSPWDIQLVGKNLIIREAERKILIDIKFDTPNKITLNRGRFLFNGVEILINKEYSVITNNNTMLSGNTFENCPCGIIIGKKISLGAGIYIENLARYPKDRTETMKWIKECFKDRE